MKRLIMIAAVVATLAPLSARAEERLSDADFVAGTRCVAYAEHRATACEPFVAQGLVQMNTGAVAS